MITVEPTCLNEGLETMTCSRCDHSETRTIEALGHNWTDWKTSKEATCEDDDKEYRECERCHEKEYQTIEALGHAYGAWEYVDDNTHQRVCDNCGEKEVSEHSWNELASIDDTNHGRVCSECGHQKTEAHNLTYTPNGSQHTKECTCGYSVTENHVWKDGNCDCGAAVQISSIPTVSFMTKEDASTGGARFDYDLILLNIPLTLNEITTSNLKLSANIIGGSQDEGVWHAIMPGFSGTNGIAMIGLASEPTSEREYNCDLAITISDSNGSTVLIKNYKITITLSSASVTGTTGNVSEIN